MLRILAANRKAAKKDMAAAKDAGDMFMYSVYNGKQLAFKVSMNSMYGFCGAMVGQMPCKPVASCTTGIGRGMIEHTQNCVEKWYPGAEVVYGDSVTGDTTVILRDSQGVRTCRIDNISGDYENRNDGKEYSEISDLEVWTDDGYTKLERVIRHKTEKKLYRVMTSTGIVDVTEDHSLLLPDGTKISPNEITEGLEILHKDVSGCITDVWRYDTEDCPSIDGAINLAKILRTDSNQIIPKAILNASINITEAFFKEFLDMDIPLSKVKNFTARNKQSASGVFILARRLGLAVTIKAVLKNNFIQMAIGGKYSNYKESKTKVKSIEYLGTTDDYVYDLTTCNHHFSVCPGNIVAHNTDSVMVAFNTGDKDPLRESFRLGEEAAERISATFKAPIELEFEKVYWPYLLFSKKRYAGRMFTNPDKADYVDAKGIQLVRRDNCKYVREVSKNVLDIIMYDMDVDKAVQYAKTAVKMLLSNQVKISDLVITKSLKRLAYIKNEQDIPPGKSVIKCDGFWISHEYKSCSQPHLKVCERMHAREPGTGYTSGSRVPYVFIHSDDKKALQYMKAEDPSYVEANNIPLDLKYYMERQLRSPLESLFEVLVDSPGKVLFDEALEQYKVDSNKQCSIFHFLDLKM